MLELLRVFIPCLFTGVVSDRLSVYKFGKLGEKIYIHKETILFYIMAFSMAVYVGLRTWYNDTVTYLQVYNNVDVSYGLIGNMKWSLGDNPGFYLIIRIFKFLKISNQTFLMLFALFTILVYMWFIHKYSNNIWLSVFLFFTMGCYTFTMAAIKQTVAVAFCLLATDRAIRKQWIRFLVFIFIGMTIHPYAAMYLVVPLLFFKPWTNKTAFTLIITALIGFGLQSLMGTIVEITSYFGEEYSLESFSGAGINVFRLLVIWAPVVLSFLVKKPLSKDDDLNQALFFNLTMLNAEIMFIALFGTANYFGRLANYFLIFQVIALPNILKYFTKESRDFLTAFILLAYSGYFYYANAINQPFDIQFSQVSLIDYLKSLLNRGG